MNTDFYLWGSQTRDRSRRRLRWLRGGLFLAGVALALFLSLGPPRLCWDVEGDSGGERLRAFLQCTVRALELF